MRLEDNNVATGNEDESQRPFNVRQQPVTGAAVAPLVGTNTCRW